ncbi:Malectin/receptor-like protein kinase family protein [Perilla frutescens var. hirtella]|uniref:Malectin/receptor-like protein kinase family protein n=1 Tax=Perilla frutescens var. hirtella TaxID=608512 RepID=A0AAD4PAG8_PERFH|nr:Malectin/receptor-like protein kinase family protein [Perilla frutescens var. hirtella]
MKWEIKIFLWAIIFSCKTITANSQTNGDSFVLACGATSDAIDSDSRKWIPDTNFLTTNNNNSSSATAKSQDPSLPSTVPYMKSRFFKSKSTYKFPISPTSRHWIRLHFYPSSYDKFDSSTSFFSVTAASFTLLSNFSASITAQALTQAYIVREFTMIRLGSGVLDLTFTPLRNTFAFINGIEIISMPEIFQPAPMVGFSDQNIAAEDYAMQMMFRLNVGGQFIAASNDSGLSRTWYDDSPYIYGAGFGITTQADSNVAIAYPSQKSRSFAPLDVYRTARSMGPNATLNQNYNLTWILDVDANFTYLVRLHLCDYRFDKVNQMVFRVFINNQTADSDADVVAWAGGKGVPMYKDYATYVNGGKNGDGQLWLALHPNVEVKPQFYDSILNGLEVYKLNDTAGNLAGPNPLQSPRKGSQKGRGFQSRSTKTGLIVGSVLGIVACLGLILGLIACLKQRNARANEGSWLPIYGGSWSSGKNSKCKSSGSSQISSLGKGLCRHFSLSDIKAGTNDFNEECVVGVGGFGKVYRGSIDGNATEVAIKRASPSSQQGMHEFLNEIELLSKLRHRHLVSLIGACEENNEMILVYDYMANGTLREHIYNNNSSSNEQSAKHPIIHRDVKSTNILLDDKWRLGICIGAARGIHYLHTGAKNPIIHRDVKSTNILLDDKWVAKVSDFGLSKSRHTHDQTHVSTVVKGSFGYLDPEYYRRQQLTDKSDVYSFGVVLFEVLCGRPAINLSLPKEQLSLADWAVLNHEQGTIDEIIDPNIKAEINQECLKHYTETAVKCLSDDSIDRPSMAEVLRNLELCLQLQTSPDGPNVAEREKALDRNAMQALLLAIEEDESMQYSANDAAFSNTLDQEGR